MNVSLDLRSDGENEGHIGDLRTPQTYNDNKLLKNITNYNHF